MVKLTLTLCTRNVGKIQRLQFQKKGVYKVPTKSMRVNMALKEQNIEVVSADEILGIGDHVPKWEKQEDLLPDFRNVTEEVNTYPSKDTKNFIVSNQISFTEGIRQACILTNTKRFKGLPQFVEDLKNKYTIKDQDLMVQKAILQSQVWNNTRDLLPKRVDRENVNWKFRREYGIPDSKSASILLDSFLHLCGSLMKDFPKSLNRRMIYKPEVQTVYNWNDNNIQISAINECMLLSDRSLPLFADSTDVKETVNYKMFDMDPIHPTIDLLPVENLTYTDVDRGALTEPLLFPQTVFRITGNPRSREANQAYNLLNTYGIALAEARQRFKKKSGDLPYPICVQNVNITYNRINFIYFQLNTFDTMNKDGVKNTAWFDTARLFTRTRCKPWLEEGNMSTPAKYGDFNPEAFSKFLATYLYGIA